MKRHPKAFWAGLVEEMERGGTVDAVARKHGVHVPTLRWWRTMLRREAKPAPPRLLPVVVSAEPGVPRGHIDVAIRGIVLRVPTGTDLDYAAALVRSLEPC